jgi:hypothetical protein
MTWYHGTTADHAEDIIHHGINWTKGLPMMDFSNGKGFYLQDNLQSAMAWAQLMARAEKQFRIQQAERRVQRSDVDLASDVDHASNVDLASNDVKTKQVAEERLKRLKEVNKNKFCTNKMHL